MEIKHLMTGWEISHATGELEELIEKRKDLISRLQDVNYNQEKILFELNQKTWKSPEEEVEVTPDAYDLAKKVMSNPLIDILREDVGL